jgi:hypothetical protein
MRLMHILEDDDTLITRWTRGDHRG